ncbi:MAG: hypothetical protein HFG83_05240 [Dorea sp.]|nr:hypothetical protein [Dorea sp.]MCI9453220.1 hypothetical protein [Dorea sp.]
MRYTEYHAGKPVIRDKELLPEAMRKLAKLEDMADVREKMCDEYCQYPCKCPNQETLDAICEKCELAKLFEALGGGEGKECLQG